MQFKALSQKIAFSDVFGALSVDVRKCGDLTF